jgi:hypothetical protein
VIKLVIFVLAVFSALLFSGLSYSSSYLNKFTIKNENYNKLIKKPFIYMDNKVSYFTYISTKPVIGDKNLYVIFHGEYSKSEKFLKMTSIQKNIIPNHHFLMPNSVSDSWFNLDTKDINKSIVKKMISIYKNKYHIDNVYIIGYSSGATFANELICDGLVVDGFLNVNGSISEKTLDNCNQIKKIKYYFSYGKKDDYYTYNDKSKINKDFKKPNINHYTLSDFENKFSKHLLCDTPVAFPYKNIDTNIELVGYTCDYDLLNRFNVVRINDMGHNWPYNNKFDFVDFRGKTNNNIDLNKYILKKFNK